VTVLSWLLRRGGKETPARAPQLPTANGRAQNTRSPGLPFGAATTDARPLHTESAGRVRLHTPSLPSPRATHAASQTDPTTGQHECRPACPLQPLEPILIPKVRIWFADFPHPHYSARQRLFTLETGCGYVYGQGESTFLSLVPTAQHLVFKDRRRRTGSGKKTARLCRPRQAHLQPNCFRALSETSRNPFGSRQKEKKTLPGAYAGVAVFSLVTDFDRRRTHTHTARCGCVCGAVSPPLPVPGAGILTGFPFVRRARDQTRQASEWH